MRSKQAGVRRGCGIDIDKTWLWVCIFILTAKNRVKEEFKQFSNDGPGIKNLITWLAHKKVTDVAFESTGVYWQLLSDKLSGKYNVLVGNPRKMKAMRGYKTDRGDGRWIAKLLRLGSIDPSYIPPRPLRELRLLTRQYHNLVQDRTKLKNRIRKILRQAGITVDLCMKNLFSISGHNMLKALIAGKDANKVASLGTRLKASRRTLLEALESAPLTPKYRSVLRRYYESLLLIDSQIKTIWDEIENAAKPYERWVALLKTIPGIGRKIAIIIVAEMGIDMSVFPSPMKLASWVGLCPGNNSSAGKRKSSRATKGNKYLRYALVQAAWGAIRKNGSYYRDYYYSNKARLGHPNKAAFAVAHKLLRACYSVLSNEKEYTESCSDDVQKRAIRIKKQLRMATIEELKQELKRRKKLEEAENLQKVAIPLPV